MCIPALGAATMFAASLGISAASSLANYVGQRNVAKAQANYQNQVAEQTAKAANNAYIEQAAATNIRTAQQQQVASQELQGLQRDRLQAQGTAVASSQSAGLSFENLMRDYYREEARQRDNIRTQLQWDMDEAQRQMLGFQAQAQDRANGAQTYMVNSPSLLGTGLQIAGSAFDSYSRYTTKDPTTGKYVFG